MELELKKGCFDAFDAGTEQILTQEETAETIVPDYCPDIARIIATEGKVLLHDRAVRDGKAEVAGTVRVSVLYTPDGESGIRALEFAMPFSAETDGKAMGECVFLAAEAEAETLETRMLNPRKVFTHCKLVLRLTGYRKAPLCFSTDVEGGAELCLERQQETQHTTLLTQIAEKDFTFSDEITLSPGKDGIAEVLVSRASSVVTETKLVGSKLILKGSFPVSVLYRTAGGQCASVSGDLPFSQIMEVEGAAENTGVSVSLQLTGVELQTGGGDTEGRQITVTLYIHATALLRQEQTITLLSDLYSTAYNVTYEAEPLQLTDRYDTPARRQTVREVLEIGVVADSILFLSASCGSVSVGREGDGTVLRTAVLVRALYLDEGGVPLVTERRLDVSCQMDIPEGCRVIPRAVCPDEVQGSLGDRGIEVRFQVEFQAQVSTRKKRVCLSSAGIDTDTPKDLSAAPSLVLRGLGKEETLWMLAKRHNTTVGDILAANGLESEGDVPREKLLLIPKKRA